MFVLVTSLVVAILLLVMGAARPRLLLGGGGAVLAFIAILALPDLTAVMGTSEHMEKAETVKFCTSCHAMEKYGKSLTIDDPRYLPAAHYQNGRVPHETACYACHTNYTMYGDIHSKWRGLRHVWANYIGGVPDKITLYTPYNNRECLHCHDAARGFNENEEHAKVGFDKIRSNEASCVGSGCHDKVHDVDHLDSLKLWTPPAPTLTGGQP